MGATHRQPSRGGLFKSSVANGRHKQLRGFTAWSPAGLSGRAWWEGAWLRSRFGRCGTLGCLQFRGYAKYSCCKYSLTDVSVTAGFHCSRKNAKECSFQGVW